MFQSCSYLGNQWCSESILVRLPAMMHISSCSCLCTRIVMICHFSKLQAFVTAAPDWSLMFTHPAGKAENYHDESRSCPTPKDPQINAQSGQPHCFCTRESESAFWRLRCLLIHLDGVRGHIWLISYPKRRSHGQSASFQQFSVKTITLFDLKIRKSLIGFEWKCFFFVFFSYLYSKH